MTIEEIPFNQYVGIRRSTQADYCLEIEGQAHHTNHLGTLHGALVATLAEASTGEFLLQHATRQVVAMIRSSSSKYSAPATGLIRSRIDTTEANFRAATEPLQRKGKALVDIQTSIFNTKETLVAKFTFRWFLTLATSDHE